MRKIIFILAFLTMPLMANETVNNTAISASKSIIDALLEMQINANCLKQTDGEITSIANSSECLNTLNELTYAFSQEKGFDTQLQRIADFKSRYHF